MKSKALLASFTAYCEANPEQRFWQALRNWAGWPFVLVAGDLDDTKGSYGVLNWRDTFYWEEMNGIPKRS